MKLYDRIDEEVEQDSAGDPLCILLTIFMFMTIFSGLTFLNFNRSTAKLLELQAADLEFKVRNYTQMVKRLEKQTTLQVEKYIPAIMEKRYIVGCKDIKETAGGYEN